MSNHKKLDFELLDKLFRYCPETGSIFNKTNRGTKAKAGAIATSMTNRGYLEVRFTEDGRRARYQAHRVVWLLHTGEDPGDNEIDHIDQNPVNNIFSNLRLVDRQENMINQRKRRNNTSGVMGVCWNKRDKKWQVQIADRGKQRNIGVFKDKFEAICCRKSAERKLGYHENHGK